MDREAWQATVHWVAQSWMEQPSNFRFHFSGACSSGERLIMRTPGQKRTVWPSLLTVVGPSFLNLFFVFFLIV